jgi:hypothetical protein
LVDVDETFYTNIMLYEKVGQWKSLSCCSMKLWKSYWKKDSTSFDIHEGFINQSKSWILNPNISIFNKEGKRKK